MVYVSLSYTPTPLHQVCTYLDLSGDPKRNNAISRMKSVLIAVKSSPPAEKKNFGA